MLFDKFMTVKPLTKSKAIDTKGVVVRRHMHFVTHSGMYAIILIELVCNTFRRSLPVYRVTPMLVFSSLAILNCQNLFSFVAQICQSCVDLLINLV